MSNVPSKAKVVVIGAGIVGNSVVYHLAKKGWKDIVLIDKGPLPNPGGSTGHASNFIFPVEASKTIVELTHDSMEQYKELGVLRESGGMELAKTDARVDELKRRFSYCKSWGIPAELLNAEETKEKFPWINEKLIKMSLWMPTVSVVDSLRAGTLMREYAQEQNALSISANTEVMDLTVKDGRIESVVTDKGTIETDYVVMACGVWTPRLAKMAGAEVALYPTVHQLIDAGPIEAFLDSKSEIEWPVIRDMSALMYERQSGKNIEVGSYAHRPILLHPDDIPSIEESKLSPTELPFTQEDFDPQMEDAIELLPELLDRDDVKVDYAINGLLSVTPDDGEPMLGETPEVKGLWSAAAVWIKEGPGVGRMLAEWMTDGYTEYDNHDVDVARVYSHVKSEKHSHDRAFEAFNKIYNIVHPMEQWESSRGLRTSSIYEKEKELGAVFYETGGWERPHWYDSNKSLLEKYEGQLMPRTYEWDYRWWSPIIHAEHLAMRESCGLVDLSAFNIFDIVGSGALDYIQYMTVNQLDVPVGRCVYTPLIDKNAGFKSDLTIIRKGENHFQVITGSMDGARDKKWFMNHLPQDGSVYLADMSSAVTTLGLWGPNSRSILEKLTKDDISNEGFKYGTAKDIRIGPLLVQALRISYVGELGYELHMPCEYARYVWDTLMEEGKPQGLVPVGMGVYGTSGRLEKNYRLYGAELETSFNPVEAGLHKPKVKKHDFIGKEAYLKVREEGVAATLCTLSVMEHDKEKRYMQGVEPILTKDGSRIVDSRGRGSYVTSAGSSPSVGKHLLMTYLPPEHAVEGKELLVEYMAEQYPVKVEVVGSRPLFDPENKRMLQ